MKKKIKSDLIIGNALIEFDKEEITLKDLEEFNNALSKFGYYTSKIATQDLKIFCSNYPFIATYDSNKNNIIVYPNKLLMNKYFRLGLEPKLIYLFENIIEIINNERVYKKTLKKVK